LMGDCSGEAGGSVWMVRSGRERASREWAVCSAVDQLVGWEREARRFASASAPGPHLQFLGEGYAAGSIRPLLSGPGQYGLQVIGGASSGLIRCRCTTTAAVAGAAGRLRRIRGLRKATPFRG